jgi:hypothetical protein
MKKEDTLRLLAEAKERVRQQKEEEELLEIQDYENLIQSQKWKVFKWIAFFSLLLSLLMTVDTLVPGETKKLPFSQIQFWQGYLRIDEAWFTPQRGELQMFQEETFTQEISLVFGETKRVCWNSEIWKYERDAPKEYLHHCSSRRFSIYEYFPLVNIAFLIPIVVVVFKRRSSWFKFMRFVCWLIIYPCSFLLSAYLIT